jgi:adenine-specific DNA-methyltransferase
MGLTQMNKLDGFSKDMEQTEREKLATVFPQCFVEGRMDIDKLLNLCGEYIIPDSEKYEFRWQGKHESLRLAQQRSTATLRPCPEESVDFDTTQNLYIEGDNLEVLKLLQTPYYRKVKMIYIDPPYNTGNDFVYEDDFRDTLARYKEVTSQTTKSNPESMGRFHTNWLNMMYPRLRLAASLLRDDGVIFISIDDNEQANLKKLCDEVFGEENFVATVIWQKVYSPKNSAKHFSEDHDFVLVYARNAEQWRPRLLPRTEEMTARYINPDNDPRGSWKPGDLSARNYYGEGTYQITCPSGRVIDGPPTGRYWVVSQKKFQEMEADGRIWWGEKGDNNPSVKRFLSEVQDGAVPQTLWFYKDVGHTQEAKKELLATMSFNSSDDVFETPKPRRLIQRMLRVATTPDENDIILDFFSGSGTTGHAVMELNKEDGGNRHFI